MTTRRRIGTVVQAVPAPAPTDLQLQVKQLVADAREAGLADEEIVDLVRGTLMGG